VTLEQSVKELCLEIGKHRHFWVAYSGGMDSHVLLTTIAYAKQALDLKVSVIHINHQLSPQSNQWADHCRKISAALSLPFYTHAIQVTHLKETGLEAAAREARYAAFKLVLQPDDVLLTAHHQDDQVETFLLQLFRGAGVKGLSAMPKLKALGQAWHARPFLSHTRAELNQYASQHKLCWIEDESNQNQNLARNYLRATIVPQLVRHWPKASIAVDRSARHCAEMQSLHEEFMMDLLQDIQEKDSDGLLIPQLLTHSKSKQRAILRFWIQQQGYPLPSEKKLLTIQQSLLTAQPDRFPLVKWKQTEMRRFRDRAYLMPTLSPHEATLSVVWPAGETQLELPGIARFSLIENLPEPITIRFRQGGECLFLPARGNLSLKNLFQEWGVPTWLRARLPLIFMQEKLVGVGGFHLPAAIRCELHPDLARQLSG